MSVEKLDKKVFGGSRAIELGSILTALVMFGGFALWLGRLDRSIDAINKRLDRLEAEQLRAADRIQETTEEAKRSITQHVEKQISILKGVTPRDPVIIQEPIEIRNGASIQVIDSEVSITYFGTSVLYFSISVEGKKPTVYKAIPDNPVSFTCKNNEYFVNIIKATYEKAIISVKKKDIDFTPRSDCRPAGSRVGPASGVVAPGYWGAHCPDVRSTGSSPVPSYLFTIR